jgi:glycosyltransferase involved in cell wall biosynthesis
MNILHITSSFLPKIGGAEIVIHNLAKTQSRLGHCVYILLPRKLYRKLNVNLPYKLLSPVPDSFHYIKQAQKIGFDIRGLMFWQIKFWHKKYNFNIAHVHFIYPAGYYVIDALKKLNIPSIVTAHGVDIQKNPATGYGHRLDPEKEQNIKETLSKFNATIAISKNIAEEYIKLGVPANKIIKIPNGVNIKKIQSMKINEKKIRKKYNLPDKKIILSVGRYLNVKGFDLIPQIIANLLKLRKNFIWVLIGKDSHKVSALTKKLGVEEYFIPISPIKTSTFFEVPPDELIKLYKLSYIFVHPTKMEAFGIVSIEAMAAGLPVVATDALGCSELVKQSNSGLISPPGDPEKMAININKLLENKEIYHQLSINALKCAQKFDWNVIAQIYCDTYKKIINGDKDEDNDVI